MKSTSLFLTACIFILNATPVMSHHGRAAKFLVDDTVTIEGKVTYYRWKNPHVYMEIQTTNENNETKTWLIEHGSPIALKRLGWKKDSINVGDNVVVVGNPNRDRNKNHMYWNQVTLENGEILYLAQRNRPSSDQSPASNNNSLVTKPTIRTIRNRYRIAETPSQDFSGTWARGVDNSLIARSNDIEPEQEFLKLITPDLQDGFMPDLGTAEGKALIDEKIEDDTETGRYLEPPRDWPLTKRGEEQVSRHDYLDNPWYDCLERGLPYFTVKTHNFLWTRFDDRIEISQQQYTSTRTLYLNQDKHPDDLKPSLMGHSIGYFDEDGSLLVDTIGFIEGVRWGLAAGLESSEQKRVRERYTLSRDGLKMDISITIEDPVYLTEPVTITGNYYFKVANDPFEPYVCDLEATRKHMSPPLNTPK